MSPSPRLRVPITLGVLAGLGCGQAARTFLDLPPKREDSQSTVRTRSSVPAVDTVRVLVPQEPPRPPIERLRDRDSILAMLPRDSAGFVDWVAASRGGVIAPRSAPGGEQPVPLLPGFEYDLVFEGLGARFPHSAHVDQLRCSTCHPGIYPRNAPRTTMAAINAGESCGACHGPVAFPASNCQRCHPALNMRPPPPDDPLGNVLVMARADSTGNQFPRARFPHWSHRIRFQCAACHPSEFAIRAGADTVKMSDISAGRSCGRCHNGRTAFGSLDCVKCHFEERNREAPAP